MDNDSSMLSDMPISSPGCHKNKLVHLICSFIHYSFCLFLNFFFFHNCGSGNARVKDFNTHIIQVLCFTLWVKHLITKMYLVVSTSLNLTFLITRKPPLISLIFFIYGRHSGNFIYLGLKRNLLFLLYDKLIIFVMLTLEDQLT